MMQFSPVPLIKQALPAPRIYYIPVNQIPADLIVKIKSGNRLL